MKELPREFTDRMQLLLGNEYDTYREALNEPAVKAFRVNTDKISVSDFLNVNVFGSEKIPYVPNGYYLELDKAGNHPFHHAGMIYIQDPGAMAPIECLKVDPEWWVLDMCAAPGGKSSQVRNKLGENGILVSNELIPSRCRILTGNVERLGLRNTVTTCLDTAKLTKLFPHCFDLVIVDAPCSGEGMFRKGDIAISEWSQENVDKCAERQDEILERATKTLRNGGYILYSTCTYSLEENEMTIDGFLNRHPEFELVRVEPSVEACTSSGIAYDGCRCANIEYTRRFYPHVSRGEGQFMAVLHNTDGADNNERDRLAAKASPKISSEVLKFLDDTLNGFDENEVTVYNGNPVIFTRDMALENGAAFSCGITVGEPKKGYIQPHHQFFMAMANRFKRRIELSPDSVEMTKFLRGEEFMTECENGWAVVTVSGCSVGGVKVVNGGAKNHYPKGLRRA